MTTPLPAAAHGGLPARPASIVLQSRALHPGTDPARLSRFADLVWDLYPALPDRHSANQAIHWDTYPAAFRDACRHYVFALVNVTEDAPRLPWARTEVPGIKTIWADLGYLRRFLEWLDGNGTSQLADVTPRDLDQYLFHVTDEPAASTTRKRKSLVAVQRLHAYRPCLPAAHQLPGMLLWGGASASDLASQPVARLGETTTPRIHPDVMETLLSATLLVTEVIAADLLPAARTLTAMRARTLEITSGAPLGETRWHRARDQVTLVLQDLARQGQPLPGIRTRRGTTVDLAGLSVAGQVDGELIRSGHFTSLISAAGLPARPGLLRATRFTAVNGRPWRREPADATEMLRLIRYVTTACFLAVAYLSGLRAGEVLNLRRGCVTLDQRLGLTFLSGSQLKARGERRERSPRAVPWVINDNSAAAIRVLEALSPSAALFPAGRWGGPEWAEDSRCRTSSMINQDIQSFITWFNTAIAPAASHPLIREDPDGSITASRLRKTLAWHIVRRPGGTVAGATQYGHLGEQLMTGYAGHAASGFPDEISFEEFLLRAEQLYDDHQRLQRGEHVSGPAAGDYRQRAAASAEFAGLMLTTPAQVDAVLANPSLQVHHGKLVTCVWRAETAACQSDDGPAWHRCRLTCSNIAYIMRATSACLA
jgi:integrase